MVADARSPGQAALLALASLCAAQEEIRTQARATLSPSASRQIRQVIAKGVLALLATSIETRAVPLQLAACACARAVSRSFRALRQAVSESTLPAAVLGAVQRGESEVVHAALAVLCNLVTGASAMRKVRLVSPFFALVTCRLEPG